MVTNEITLKKCILATKKIILKAIYNTGINLLSLGLKTAANFNVKIKKGVVGRSQTFNILNKNLKHTDSKIWFHCASLGEYEQGLPVFKELRDYYKNHKIILSFFSPSGYEIRKNSPIADIVVYLPLDTKKNAKRFVELVNPELTVFVKYDIWANYLNEIKQKNLKAILISASFRASQSYFKFYGNSLKQALFAFEHIFTQNEDSKRLLETINYNSVTVAGDTRFDRVTNQLKIDNNLDFIDKFKENKLCFVAGSTWPECEALLCDFINKTTNKEIKFIIAPHNIKSSQIKDIQSRLKVNTILFSKKEEGNLSDAKVFIIDTIGILSKIYSYADITYVGGALGKTGLHNILEPAVFGSPVIIGNNHSKFPEAKAMIANGGVFSISNQNEFDYIANELINNEDKRLKTGQLNTEFISKNKGAVDLIIKYLLKN